MKTTCLLFFPRRNHYRKAQEPEKQQSLERVFRQQCGLEWRYGASRRDEIALSKKAVVKPQLMCQL